MGVHLRRGSSFYSCNTCVRGDRLCMIGKHSSLRTSWKSILGLGKSTSREGHICLVIIRLHINGWLHMIWSRGIREWCGGCLSHQIGMELADNVMGSSNYFMHSRQFSSQIDVFILEIIIIFWRKIWFLVLNDRRWRGGRQAMRIWDYHVRANRWNCGHRRI